MARNWNCATCHQTSLKGATCLDFSECFLAPHHRSAHPPGQAICIPGDSPSCEGLPPRLAQLATPVPSIPSLPHSRGLSSFENPPPAASLASFLGAQKTSRLSHPCQNIKSLYKGFNGVQSCVQPRWSQPTGINCVMFCHISMWPRQASQGHGRTQALAPKKSEKELGQFESQQEKNL